MHVLQGEREISTGNRSLARFELVGRPTAPRGIPQIEVSFEIDADGIVSVSARDKMTNNEQLIKITPSSGLSATEIYDLMEEATRNVEADRRLKEVILARNRLEGLLQNSQRSFSEFGWMLSAQDQEIVRTALERAHAACQSEDGDAIRAALETLEHAALMISDAMFKPASVAKQGSEEEDGVVDSGTKALPEST